MNQKSMVCHTRILSCFWNWEKKEYFSKNNLFFKETEKNVRKWSTCIFRRYLTTRIIAKNIKNHTTINTFLSIIFNRFCSKYFPLDLSLFTIYFRLEEINKAFFFISCFFLFFISFFWFRLNNNINNRSCTMFVRCFLDLVVNDSVCFGRRITNLLTIWL